MSKTTCGHTKRKVFSNGDCRECATVKYIKAYQHKRQEQRKNKPLQKINQQSDQRIILNKIYKILCKEFKPLHPVCEGQLPGCTHKATEIHHKKGRRGLLLILSKYFGYLCSNCHTFCTKNSKAAKELGLSMQINSRTDFDFTPRELELLDRYEVKLKIINKLK